MYGCLIVFLDSGDHTKTYTCQLAATIFSPSLKKEKNNDIQEDI